MNLPWQEWVAFAIMFLSVAIMGAYAIGECRGEGKGRKDVCDMVMAYRKGYTDGLAAKSDRERTAEDEACDAQ